MTGSAPPRGGGTLTAMLRSADRLLALAALTALAGGACFERGGGGERAAPPPAATAAPTTDGWLASDPPGAIDPDATVRMALEAEPATLDPFATLDAASARVLSQVVEGLACPTADGGVEPCVASRWRASADRRTWRFTLDPARRFADGGPITAADVIASLDASRGVGHASGPLGFALDDAVAITAPHPDEIELVVREDRPTRLRDLAMVPIVPAAQLAAPSLAERPIGSGPFAVAAWVRGERIALARVSGAARRASAARVELVVVADRADAIRQLAAGRLDVVAQVPAAEAVAAAQLHPALVRFRYRQPAALVAVINTRRPALADARTRRALVMTLDRAGVARAVLGGAPTLNGPWLPDQPERDPALAPLPFDPAAAAALRPPPAPVVRLLVPAGSTASARIADIWAADARGAFTLEVEAVPFAELLARLAAGDFDLAITSLSAGPEVDPADRLSAHAPPTQAWPGLVDAELERWFDAWHRATAADERLAAAHAIERRVQALAPLVYIAVDTRGGLARADIGGLVGDGRGVPPAWRLWRARP